MHDCADYGNQEEYKGEGMASKWSKDSDIKAISAKDGKVRFRKYVLDD